MACCKDPSPPGPSVAMATREDGFYCLAPLGRGWRASGVIASRGGPGEGVSPIVNSYVGHHTREAKNLLKLRIRVKIRHESGGRRGRSKCAFWVQANFGSFRPVFGEPSMRYIFFDSTQYPHQHAGGCRLPAGSHSRESHLRELQERLHDVWQRNAGAAVVTRHRVQAAYVSNNAVGLYGPEYPNAYTGAETRYTPYTNVNPGLGEFMLLFLACQVVRFS